MTLSNSNFGQAIQDLEKALREKVEEKAKLETELRALQTEIPRLEQDLKNKNKRLEELKHLIRAIDTQHQRDMNELRQQQDAQKAAMRKPIEHADLQK